jgi:hypothetical protein
VNPGRPLRASFAIGADTGMRDRVGLSSRRMPDALMMGRSTNRFFSAAEI